MDSTSTAAQQLSRYIFLTGIGDWASETVKSLRQCEKDFVKRKKASDKRIKEGVSKYEARADFKIPISDNEDEAATTAKLCMMSLSATELQHKIDKELQLVFKWSKSGKIAASAPATPYLDRLVAICDEYDLGLTNVRDCVEINSDRNVIAHHPPPAVADFVNHESTASAAQEKVDWEQMYQACIARKQSVQDDVNIADDHKRRMERVIDRHWDSLCRGRDSDGAFILTPLADKALKRAIEDHKTTSKKSQEFGPSDLCSTYREGKWDVFDTL